MLVQAADGYKLRLLLISYSICFLAILGWLLIFVSTVRDLNLQAQ